MVVSEELIRFEKLLLQMMEKSGWAFILDMGIMYITCKITMEKLSLETSNELGSYKQAYLKATIIFF